MLELELHRVHFVERLQENLGAAVSGAGRQLGSGGRSPKAQAAGRGSLLPPAAEKQEIKEWIEKMK